MAILINFGKVRTQNATINNNSRAIKQTFMLDPVK